MNTDSIDFIYKALNEIASGKHCPEMEQCLAYAIEQGLLAINAQRMLEDLIQWRFNVA